MNQPFKPHLHNRGIHRREILQAGFMGLLGLGLPDLFRMRAAQADTGRAGAATSPRGPRARVA